MQEHAKILLLPHGKDLEIPRYASKGSSGLDLRAAIEGSMTLKPGMFELVPTGICIELPEGLEAQIRPRSGLAAKFGITVLNSPGTVDQDYRGEIKVCLVNLSKNEFTINRGDRIAQMVIAKVEQILLVEAEEIGETERASGSFGSTGTE
ncbi:dUTP diphosphatase [Neorickettsia sennetsu]|uniref:Deoxyuridine 5'-triphosphate nucleotidohydrolase n=1 Tax=Ehrlichia sennetsu (strain ATCC VR-367 / Miyayama) TaxID=222891 RepID=DUT_EHRS3|nr:dUTP diphosphatase [Neorickettsia sennetsu]Q2GCH5.1 RecName: Full=Deoxyuridine 5'-triphosphate nucleotidohydrolase; Short=dUTPase; AltName: Full=dUTP pyrophosphatase [Neorickettsia sennetsu str. Miyayama]ABD46095.1 deoxyuridine 5'triphosphate nucleotidohydrolase [Neorickettsia sennetsu str. Miyayama]